MQSVFHKSVRIYFTKEQQVKTGRFFGLPQLLTLSRNFFVGSIPYPNFYYRAVNLDKKENRVVKRLLCCGSPNWARTSDIMINSHALYRLSYGGI